MTLVAAGTVIVRGQPTGCDVLLVHRPSREDWSFPKGLTDDGEDLVACARRETFEETGFVVEPLGGPRTFDYVKHHPNGRRSPKRVWLWLAEIVDGNGIPIDPEVDAHQWFSVREATQRVSAGWCTAVLAALPAWRATVGRRTGSVS